jgi:hypothetical protein
MDNKLYTTEKNMKTKESSYVHELFEELQAFDPHWNDRFNSLQEAVDFVAQETPYINEMHIDFLNTPEGRAYEDDIASVFDYQGAIKAEKEAARKMRFNLDNIGTTGSWLNNDGEGEY